MILKLMGVGDFLASVAIFATALRPTFFPSVFILWCAGYLIVKGGLFALMGNKVSYMDVFCGFYLLFLRSGFSVPILSFFAVLFLSQKTIFSVL